jgi:hypothetical protein
MPTPEIKLECHTIHDVASPMAFCATWSDATHNFHVWISLRPDVDGIAPPYPVAIETTAYKNSIVDTRRNAIKIDLNAAKNAPIKAAIKKAATAETLRAMFEANRAAMIADDEMRAEAWRLNRIHNALATLRAASGDDLAAVMLNRPVEHARAAQTLFKTLRRSPRTLGAFRTDSGRHGAPVKRGDEIQVRSGNTWRKATFAYVADNGKIATQETGELPILHDALNVCGIEIR